jgi:hypothetical protein
MPTFGVMIFAINRSASFTVYDLYLLKVIVVRWFAQRNSMLFISCGFFLFE